MFGGSIPVSRFLGLQSAVADSRSKTLPVTLLWDTLTPPGGDYTAFVHVVDSQGRQVAGYDQPPAWGRLCTCDWAPSDRIVSHFAVDLPGDLAAGAYQVQVGLYETDSAGANPVPLVTNAFATKDQARFWER